ncbi:hypothetical protein HYS00_02500 [Candidatus Microgenomates bacterium]|nr:hypothetical protein [Candidatus Microgenomates bacterium]
MKKIRSILYPLLFVVISFFFVQIASAQTTTPNSGAGESQRWVCLDAQWCADGTAQCRSTGLDVHTVKLSAKPDFKPLSNINTYVVECVSDGTTEMCTSGVPAVDMKIYGADNSAKLAQLVNYKFLRMVLSSDGVTPATNPTMSNAAGDIGPFEWESETPHSQARKFLAVNFFNGIFADPGSSSGQQQGTLDFETSAKDCEAFNWDPYGRVFDSKTLEPLKGVTVSLSKLRDQGAYSLLQPSEILGGALINPQITKADGNFSFVVPDATYHLTPSVSGYRFPVDSLSAMNPDYSKVYKDIYPAANGMDILQRGAIVHRDIPMEAIGTPQNNPPEMMEYFTQLDKLSNSYIIEGRVSHPFTTVNIWTQKAAANGQITPHYRKIVSANADKTGYFKMVVNQKDFEDTEMIGEAELIKSSAAAMQKPAVQSLLQKVIGIFVPSVSAQVRSNPTVKLNPIPNYIEGVAYSAAGQPIPNASVSVYLTFSNVPYYTTQADADGHFRITSERLPFMPYTIGYKGVNGAAVTKVTTEKFLSQNAKYIEDNKIDVNEYKDARGRTGQQVLEQKTTNAAAKMQADANTNKGMDSQNSFAIVIFVIMLLVVVAAILVLYLRNKNKAPGVEL